MLIAIDTETTGVNPAEAELLQVAAVTEYGALFNTLCRTDKPIPETATAIHGIDNQRVKFGVYPRQAVQLLMACIAPTDILVTYNGTAYDLPLLQRYGFPVVERHIDVMHLVCRDYSLHKAGLKLQQVYEGCTGGDMDDAHDAAADAFATLQILCQYIKDTGKTSGKLLEELSQPKILSTCYFGKHTGKAFDDIPLSYLQYIRSKFDNVSADLDVTLKAYGA